MSWHLDHDDRPGMDWNIHVCSDAALENRVCFLSKGPDTEKNAKLIAAAPDLRDALAGMLDLFRHYDCPEIDAAISAMHKAGDNRHSVQSLLDKHEAI